MNFKGLLKENRWFLCLKDILNRPVIKDGTVVVCYLIFITSLYLYQNYLFINADNTPVISDFHFIYSHRFYEYVLTKGVIPPLDATSIQYQPLIYLLSGAFFKVLGVSYFTARLSLFVFSVIFILSMYGIGKETGGRIGGICVSALALSSVQILYFSRLYFMDFPQTATTALCYYLLLKTDGYRRPLFCYLLGIALGLSILTKWSTVFYMAFPVLWFAFPAILRNRKNLILAVLTMIYAGFSCWRYSSTWNYDPGIAPKGFILTDWFQPYFYNVLIPSAVFLALVLFLNKILPPAWGDSGKKSEMAGFAGMVAITELIVFPWLYWAVNSLLFKHYMDTCIFRHDSSEVFTIILSSFKSNYSFFILLMPVGILSIFPDKKHIYRNLSPLIALLVSVGIFTFLGYHDIRYLLSMVIFTAIIGGFWIGRAGVLRRPLALVLVTVSILSFTGWMIPGNGIYNTLSLQGDPEFLNFCKLNLFDLRLHRTDPPDLRVKDLGPIFSFARKNTVRKNDSDLISFCIYDDFPGERWYYRSLTEEDFYIELLRVGQRDIFPRLWRLGYDDLPSDLVGRRKIGRGGNDNLLYISYVSEGVEDRKWNVNTLKRLLASDLEVEKLHSFTTSFRERFNMTIFSFQYPEK